MKASIGYHQATLAEAQCIIRYRGVSIKVKKRGLVRLLAGFTEEEDVVRANNQSTAMNRKTVDLQVDLTRMCSVVHAFDALQLTDQLLSICLECMLSIVERGFFGGRVWS